MAGGLAKRMMLAFAFADFHPVRRNCLFRQKDNAMLAGNCPLLEKNKIAYFYDGGYLGRNAFVNESF
ncbi:MAG: hypothetical protein Q8P02_00950 [Candidatus Micrarchaeota archaeon]|nr:hypothetical protein [Candidatus Micrarchaeota archaeon]